MTNQKNQKNWCSRMAGGFRPAAAAAMLVIAGGQAVAQTDRIIDTPTGWIYRYGASPATIDADIGGSWRPISIQRTAPDSYDVVSVYNGGEYNVPGFSTAHTYFAMTPANLATAIAGERIIDLDCFELNDTTYMSAVTIPNSGTEASGWNWTYNQASASAVINWADGLSPAARLIDMEKYVVNGVERWAGVTVSNSGNQSQGWWWALNQTAAGVTTLLTQHSARLIDIEVQTPPTLGNEARFAVLMVSENPGGGWWHPAASAQQVSDLINQHGARLSCLEHYTDAFGQDRYAVALVDNANDQTRRVRNLMDNALSDGVYGFQLKQVGGSVLASLNDSYAFEPASMLKILHGAYAMDRCAAGTDNLSNDVWINDKCNNNECPDTTSDCSAGFEDLGQAMREMLEQSDNNRTMEIELRYGRTTLNNYAASLGLGETQINHRLGCLCGNPFNTFSCRDAVKLYEKIADGSLFDQAWQDALYERMLNLEDNTGWNLYPTLSSVITQEAANTSLTASELSAFRTAVRFANKGGGYGCSGTTWRTEGGWVSLPFKSYLGQFGWIQLNREYTLAVFVHGSTDADSTIAYSMKEEMLREQVRAALQSWDSACQTPDITNQPDAITRTVGQSASFSITVDGTIGGRQWQKSPDGINGWVNVTGDAGVFQSDSTAAILLTNLTLSDAGFYRCIITSVCGTENSSRARLTVNPCTADFNASGSVTVQDIFDFLSAYFSNSAAADVNGVGGVTVQDIFDFLSHYFAGC